MRPGRKLTSPTILSIEDILACFQLERDSFIPVTMLIVLCLLFVGSGIISCFSNSSLMDHYEFYSCIVFTEVLILTAFFCSS